MRHRLGAICWVLTIVYFLVQPFVAAAWDPAYSFSDNTISDLGYARCGPADESWRSGAYLCSPRHALMNAAFVLVGLLTAAGAVLNRGHWPSRRPAKIGIVLIALSGVGLVLIGLAPGDVNLPLHLVGVALELPGVAAPLLLGLALRRDRRWERAFSIAMGAIGFIGCLLFVSGLHLGLGIGGVERLGLEPLTVWTVVMGAMLLLRPGARG